jgi:uncharacterized protein
MALIVSAALIAAAMLGGCTTKVETTTSNPQANTVTAQGNGTVSAIPDQAVMSFSVSTQAKDAKAALDKVSGKASRISSAIKKAGVADKDIQTTNVSVDAQYANSTGPRQPAIIGYQAQLSVTAKVRDLASLSKVIGAASSAGVDNISGPTFSIAEDSTYRQQAIAKAVDDARTTASAMAKAAGKSLGDVVSVTSNRGYTPTPLGYTDYTAAAPKAADAVPIQNGQLDVTADVTVVFALK